MIKKALLVIPCSYLLFTVLMLLYYTTLGIDEARFSGLLDIIPATICLIIILATLVVNVLILLNLNSIRRKWIFINLLICLLQSIHILINDFQFRYVQGYELVTFINFNSIEDKLTLGWYYYPARLNFILQFIHYKNSAVALNLIYVVLLLVFFLIWRHMKPEEKVLV